MLSSLSKIEGEDTLFYKHVSSKKAFNDMASSYDLASTLSWSAPKNVANTIQPYLKKASRDKFTVLDIGIGTGQLSRRIKSNNPETPIQVSGVDISDKMIERCKRKNIAKRLCVTDLSCQTLPKVLDNFDFVISSGVFEFIPNPENAIKEMCRVTNKEGYVCFTVECPRNFHLKAMEAFSSALMTILTLHKPQMARTYTHASNDIKRLLKENGMTLIKEEEFKAYGNFLTGQVKYNTYLAQKI